MLPFIIKLYIRLEIFYNKTSPFARVYCPAPARLKKKAAHDIIFQTAAGEPASEIRFLKGFNINAA